jgi:hypothetical protein
MSLVAQASQPSAIWNNQSAPAAAWALVLVAFDQVIPAFNEETVCVWIDILALEGVQFIVLCHRRWRAYIGLG